MWQNGFLHCTVDLILWWMPFIWRQNQFVHVWVPVFSLKNIDNSLRKTPSLICVRWPQRQEGDHAVPGVSLCLCPHIQNVTLSSASMALTFTCSLSSFPLGIPCLFFPLKKRLFGSLLTLLPVYGMMVAIRPHNVLFLLWDILLFLPFTAGLLQRIACLLSVSLKLVFSKYLSVFVVPTTFSHSLLNSVKLGVFFKTHLFCHKWPLNC